MRSIPLLSLAALTAACGAPASAPPTATPAPPATASPALTSPAPAPPTARTDDVVETRFGVELRDPYRWMEGDDNASSRERSGASIGA